MTGAIDPKPTGLLADLFASARERGITLRAGAIMSNGSACLPFARAGADAALSATVRDREVSLPRRD